LERDPDNVTYVHSLETLRSEEGRRYQREKYLPKIEFLAEKFGESFREVRLLDVGVGYGFFLSMLEKESGLRDLHGMDPFPKSIEIASQMTSAKIVSGDITDDRWPFDAETFDVVTCFDVVEHLEKPDDFFRMVMTVLKPGGIVVVTTPNLSLPYRMRSWPLIGIPETNPTHINIRKPSYWRELASQNGFDLIAEWRGEHLSHVRFLPKLMRNACRVLHLDHRKIPLLNSFEQAYCMILELPPVSTSP